MNTPTIEQIRKAYDKKKYILSGYKLNIIGIRAKDVKPNVFNDLIVLAWFKDNAWNIKSFNATTEPGSYYLQNPMNVNGTAIMVPGQYIDAYKIGQHTGYPALQQANKIKVYRDKDKDNQFDLDPNTIQDGVFATNIHHAGNNSTQVDKWSAGCQVIASMKEWNEFWNIITAFGKNQNFFTYTLIEEIDL